jgi:hypothetical protein
MSTSNWWALGISALMVLYGLHLRRQRQRLIQIGQLTTGFVVDFDDGPVIKFRTSDQLEITVKPIGPSRTYYMKGDAVRLYYNPDEPEQFAVDELLYAGVPWVFIAMGILCALAVSGW